MDLTHLGSELDYEGTEKLISCQRLNSDAGHDLGREMLDVVGTQDVRFSCDRCGQHRASWRVAE